MNLKPAIDRALANGWKIPRMVGETWKVYPSEIAVVFETDLDGTVDSLFLEQILFDVPFLKALFGEEKVCQHCGTVAEFFRGIPVTCPCGEQGQVIEAWIYHGQQLVPPTNPERLKYIGDFMEGK